jgi:hypothetical protein
MRAAFWHLLEEKQAGVVRNSLRESPPAFLGRLFILTRT